MGFVEDIRKPIIIISLIIALIAIILSIYFYNQSISERKPTYLISENRQQIFDNSISSPNIKVLESDSVIIKDNIYLATITFWNGGNLSIEPSDIRKPIRLKLTNHHKLLDYSITKQTNPEIVNFRITRIPVQNNSESLLEFTWDHLDPNFGIQLQLIYSGVRDIAFSFDGYVLGVGQPINGLSLAEKSKFWKLLKDVVRVLGLLLLAS